MKRFVIFLLILLLCLSGSACGKTDSKQTPVSEAMPTVVQLPTDDSVNGYRTGSQTKPGSSMPNTVSAEQVTAGSGETATSADPSSASFCANTNTKVFHRSDCSSVSKIQQKNRLYSSDRSQLMAEGYSPCKRCAP